MSMELFYQIEFELIYSLIMGPYHKLLFFWL